MQVPEKQDGPLVKEASLQQLGLSLAASIFSGVGLGLMVGIIMGLSASPTVGVVIGAVGTGLAALLGLNDSQFSTSKAVRIGAFGFSVVIAALSGVFIRDHHLLTPSPPSLADRKAEYKQLGYSEAEALSLLKRDAASPQQTKSVLYATEVELTDCEKLKNPYESTLSPHDVVDFFVNAGLLGKRLTEVSNELEGDDQKRFLLIARDAVCGMNGEDRLKQPDQEQCKQLREAIGKPAQDLRAAIAASELRRPARRIQTTISSTGQPKALLTLVRLGCHWP